MQSLYGKNELNRRDIEEEWGVKIGKWQIQRAAQIKGSGGGRDRGT
jgi:hypothetical protein